MSLEHDVIQSIAQILYSALKNGTTIAPLTDQYPDISVDDAYRISKQVLQLRMDNDNELVVGKKIGVTSSAVQDNVGGVSTRLWISYPYHGLCKPRRHLY